MLKIWSNQQKICRPIILLGTVQSCGPKQKLAARSDGDAAASWSECDEWERPRLGTGSDRGSGPFSEQEPSWCVSKGYRSSCHQQVTGSASASAAVSAEGEMAESAHNTNVENSSASQQTQQTQDQHQVLACISTSASDRPTSAQLDTLDWVKSIGQSLLKPNKDLAWKIFKLFR